MNNNDSDSRAAEQDRKKIFGENEKSEFIS